MTPLGEVHQQMQLREFNVTFASYLPTQMMAFGDKQITIGANKTQSSENEVWSMPKQAVNWLFVFVIVLFNEPFAREDFHFCDR